MQQHPGDGAGSSGAAAAGGGGPQSAADASAAAAATSRYTRTQAVQLNLVHLANFARISGNFEGDPLAFGNPHKKGAGGAAAVALSDQPKLTVESGKPGNPMPGAPLLTPQVGFAVENVPKSALKGVSGLLSPLGGVLPGSTLFETKAAAAAAAEAAAQG